jgi:hypothetical protein
MAPEKTYVAVNLDISKHTKRTGKKEEEEERS